MSVVNFFNLARAEKGPVIFDDANCYVGFKDTFPLNAKFDSIKL